MLLLYSLDLRRPILACGRRSVVLLHSRLTGCTLVGPHYGHDRLQVPRHPGGCGGHQRSPHCCMELRCKLLPFLLPVYCVFLREALLGLSFQVAAGHIEVLCMHDRMPESKSGHAKAVPASAVLTRHGRRRLALQQQASRMQVDECGSIAMACDEISQRHLCECRSCPFMSLDWMMW